MSTLPSYPQEKLDEWKAQYIELLRSTGREGIESLIQYLEEETDFFTAPASTKWHGAVYGGPRCWNLQSKGFVSWHISYECKNDDSLLYNKNGRLRRLLCGA